jgi:hypothetical protein
VFVDLLHWLFNSSCPSRDHMGILVCSHLRGTQSIRIIMYIADGINHPGYVIARIPSCLAFCHQCLLRAGVSAHPKVIHHRWVLAAAIPNANGLTSYRAAMMLLMPGVH